MLHNPLPPTHTCIAPAGLQTLVLDHNQLTALPQALAAATRLRRLSLQANPLQLTPADVAGTLERLPALAALDVSEGQLL